MEQNEYRSIVEEAIKYYNIGFFRTSSNVKIRNANFWDTAEIIEIFEDAYNILGDFKYQVQVRNLLDSLMWKSNDFTNTPFNDDVLWITIALARASLLFNSKKYAEAAKFNFDKIWERAWDVENGGMYWRVENTVKNTCITCPTAIAACLLGKIFNDKGYFEKAVLALNWVADTLFDKETGKVWDKVTVDGVYDYTSYTYNQGTFIGACCLLYEYTKDDKYLEFAGKSADYTMNTKYNGGIMNDEEDGADNPGFKGILARWLRLYATEYDHPEYIEWLRTNGLSAWENRNSYNIMQTQLAKKSEDIDYPAFTCSAPVSILINAI